MAKTLMKNMYMSYKNASAAFRYFHRHSFALSWPNADMNYKGCTEKDKSKLQHLLIEDIKILNSLLPLFPQPKQLFNNFYNVLKNNSKSKCNSVVRFSKFGSAHSPTFCCTLNLEGPLVCEFIGYSNTKKVAESVAVIKALSALYEEKLMNISGQPYEMRERDQRKLRHRGLKSLLQEPLLLSMNIDSLMEAQNIIDVYRKDFQSFIRETLHVQEKNGALDEREDYFDFIRGKMQHFDDESFISFHRNNFLFNSLSRNEISHNKYPIYEYRCIILDAISKNQVVIIQGGTGCGKSTQVPQIVFDEWIKEGRGCHCNIVVTQPRRIAALSIAHWVAKERGEQLGSSVGFKMRMNSVLPRQSGGIVFYTVGTLLQLMIHNPSLRGVSHIIVDEVHERTMDIDVLLILLKDLIMKRTDLRVILMSATADTSKLINYFSCSEENLVTVIGKSYPIQTYYIDQIKETLGVVTKETDVLNVSNRQPLITQCDVIVKTVLAIHEQKPSGAILVFVPGWRDIMEITSDLERIEDILVVPLHSSLPIDIQKKAFSIPEDGTRKVVIATNIAETSLTIDDIVYVVDSGLCNTSRYCHERDFNVFSASWITKANAIQRAGRAGRIQAGEVYRMYNRHTFDQFLKYPSPEILEQSLENLCLKIKVIASEERVEDILGKLLDAPPKIAVKQAISNLFHLGLLKMDKFGNESLTRLGRFVGNISTEPHLAKALVFSILFRCFDSTLNIVAFEGKMNMLFEERLESKEFRILKEHYSCNSDLVALSRLVDDIDASILSYNLSKTSCKQITPTMESEKILPLLSAVNFKIYEKVRKLLSDQIKNRLPVDPNNNSIKNRLPVDPNNNSIKNRLPVDPNNNSIKNRLPVDPSNNSIKISHESLKEAQTISSHLVNCCFLTSSLHLLRRLPSISESHFFTKTGGKIIVQKSSVLSSAKCEFGTTDLILPLSLIFSQERLSAVASDLCIVKPLAVALLFGPDVQLQDSGEDGQTYLVFRDHSLSFLTNKQTAECLTELRSILTEMIDYLVVCSEAFTECNRTLTFADSNDEDFGSTKELNYNSLFVSNSFLHFLSEFSSLISRITE